MKKLSTIGGCYTRMKSIQLKLYAFHEHLNNEDDIKGAFLLQSEFHGWTLFCWHAVGMLNARKLADSAIKKIKIYSEMNYLTGEISDRFSSGSGATQHPLSKFY